MEARMKSPALLDPRVFRAVIALGKTTEDRGVPATTIALTHLRASQINGCGLCVEMHSRELAKMGATEAQIYTTAAWRDSPFFTDAERAALALTEAVTRIADREDPVPDSVWDEAKRHYDETQLAALLVSIATINVWNRLNVATRQPALGMLPDAAAFEALAR